MLIPTKNKIGICSVCQSEAHTTYGHRVPAWLFREMALYGFDFKKIIVNAGITGKMWQKECAACNTAKGSTLDWKDPLVRKFLSSFVAEVNEKLEAAVGPRKLIAICGCGRKEPCAVVPSVIDSRISVATPIPAKPTPIVVGKTWDTNKPHIHWKGTCWCGHIDIPETEATPEKLLAAEKWKEKSMKRNDKIVAEIIETHGGIRVKEEDMVKQD